MTATNAESNARWLLSSNGDVSHQRLDVRMLAMMPFSLLTWAEALEHGALTIAVMEITQR
jgi:hypothetical protein